MKLQIRRVMLFVRDMKTMAQFYEERLGLKVLERSTGFVDLDAGSCRLALHRTGVPRPGRTKICFFTEDVTGVRAELMKQGVTVGKASNAGTELNFCDAKDPEGNVLQFSNRP